MTEEQIFAMYGRSQAELALVKSDYAKLVDVVRGIKSGEIAVDRITINTDGTWAVGGKAG